MSSFNPRPPLLAGEPKPNAWAWHLRRQFQSTPAIAGGRTLHWRWQAAEHGFVSIHARHCWRANPHKPHRPGLWHLCFNPRPPLLAGEPGPATACCPGPGRFNPRPPLLAGEPILPDDSVIPWRWFQSTPAIAGGRTLDGSIAVSGADLFQSTPAIAGGRTHQGLAMGTKLLSFNPRPPLLAGEPKSPGRVGTPGHCFNPRPPLLAGEPLFGIKASESEYVSIHARHCWRANPSWCAGHR